MNKIVPLHLETTFVHLGADGQAVPLEVNDKFWENLGSGHLDHLGSGRLVSQMTFTENWATWEMHPQGEEIVCLLSGAMDLILSQEGIERSVSLTSPGSFVIVPRGTWHTANVLVPGAMLFITPGDGTEHRPR